MMRSLLVVIVLLLSVPAACASDPGTDAGPPGDAATESDGSPTFGPCRGQADCASSSDFCYGPNESNCGIPPREECENDGSCGGTGELCHSIDDSCSEDGVGSTCGTACDPVTSPCGSGFVCDATGHCRPPVCGEGGFTCPISERCDPASIDTSGPAHAITDGCVAVHCATDATCPATTRCVNGRCQDGLGTCEPPAP
jgi:hypothetical protein